jgi:hypothetical protein
LVGPLDGDAAQQVRVDLVAGAGRLKFGFGVGGFDHRICLGCMGLAIGKLQNAVYNHRPTNTNMQTAIDDAVRPLTERIATLELEMAALRQALDGRQPAGVLPYTKTKTEAAREMLMAGLSSAEQSG